MIDTESEDRVFRDLLATIEEDDDFTPSEKRQLQQQPTKIVTPKNIFTWHLDQYTVFENETDPIEIKYGVRYRRVGVKDGGRLSEEEITREEKRLGVRLPDPWREVYRHFNGGFNDTLHWGDYENPKYADIVPIPNLKRQYLELSDVAPLKTFLAKYRYDLDTSTIDERLITIAYCDSDHETIVLDYRKSDDPAVGKIIFCEYDDNPIATFEEEGFWWPNMRIFFRGLYIQDRLY